MNKEKIMLSILREISENNIPTEQDYELSIRDFYKICRSLENEEYLSDLPQLTEYINGVCDFSLEDAEITLKGIEYVKNNKLLFKGYKGLKEIRYWLPF